MYPSCLFWKMPSMPSMMNSKYTLNIAFYVSYALWAVARSARYERGRHLAPLCMPLRALGWGYDCFALRAMSLRDDVAPFGQMWRKCLACTMRGGAVRPACALSHSSRDCLWLMAYGLRLCGSSGDLGSSRKQKS